MSRVKRVGAAQVGAPRLAEPTQASRAGEVTPLRDRIPFLLILVVLALGLRVGAAVTFDQFLTTSGRGGFLSADEFGYDRVAWAQAQAWRGVGPGVVSADTYLLNPYTYTEAVVYVAVGHRPLVMKLINCLFGALAAGLVYLITRRLFGHLEARLSGLAAAFFPTTLLFSIVNLKDAMFLVVVALLMWLLTAMLSTGRHWLVLPVLAVLVIIGGLRIYIQGVFVALVPAAVALQNASRFPRKWLTSATLFVGCVAIFWFSGGARWMIGYVPFIDQQRYASALGAKSAYVAFPTEVPAAARASDGVATPGGSNGAGGAGGRGTAGTSSGSGVNSSGSGSASGRPGETSPPPGARPSDPLAVATTMPAPTRGSASVRSLLTWLPMGILFAIAAPFPWAAHRAIEQFTIPEMLLWYTLLALAVLGVITHRRQWRSYAHLVAYVGGVLLIFAIGQGNLGTLIRQRSMMIAPFVFIFSGAGAMWLWERWRSRRPAALYGEQAPSAAVHSDSKR